MYKAASQTIVAPLLGNTAWDQGWPYNTMCPTIDGQNCLTGCVATAMAQAMYYYKWPQKGKGSISYELNGQILSTDFSKSTYRWNLMTPTYSGNSSQGSIDAVALLMKDAGYACKMEYGLYSSGASGHGVALTSYFDYDASIGFLERDNCNAQVWNDTIVNELVNKRPLLYIGGGPYGSHASKVSLSRKLTISFDK